MAKHYQKVSAAKPRKKKRSAGRIMLISLLVIVALLALLVVSAMLFGELPEESGTGDQSEASASETSEVSSEATPEPTGIAFPYKLEEQDIEIRSLLSASIANPDAGGAIGEDIAGLELCNTTGTFIVKAEFEAKLEDGTVYRFAVHDVPADGTVTAFELENAVYDRSVSCESITCTGIETAQGDQLMSDSISVSVEGTAVTLTNTTGSDIGPLEVICLCELDGGYFGGTSYRYAAEGIPAGGSVTVDAADCYLEKAAVVRILPAD